MLYIFDKDENLLEILNEDDFFNDMYKRQINKEWSFYFETKVNTSTNLKRKSKVGFYDKDNVFQLFEIDEVEDDISFDDDTKAVSTLHDYYRLGNKIVEDKRIVEGSCRDALEKALEGTGYNVGNVAELGLKTLNFYYITSLEAINKIIEIYGGELNFRFEMNSDNTAIANRYVDIINRHGEDSGIRYTLDTNILNMKRYEIPENHYTVLYGRGASLETDGGGFTRLIDFADVVWSRPDKPANKPLGQKFIEDVEAIEKYGRIEGIYENKDITDPAMLLQYTWDSLQTVKEQKYNYSAKVEDVSSIKGYEHFKVNLGDTIIILDEEYSLNEEARIIEERYPITDMNNTYIEMGYFLPGITDIDPDLPGGGAIGGGGSEEEPEIDGDDFPDTLPSVPIVNAKGGFATVALDWTYENKLYYDYEVYASQLENFTPDASNLVFRGKASVLLHEVKPSQTWYYRVRAINTHGRYTEYSAQVSASTKKISDAAEYFEELAIADALIGNLNLDRGWIGQLDATYLNVKGKFTVTDGNGKKTLDIDSFGNVNLDVTSLKISSKSVATNENVDSAKREAISKAVNDAKSYTDTNINTVKGSVSNLEEEMNTSFKDGIVNAEEAKRIKDRIIVLEKDKALIDKQYTTIYNNANLLGAYKTNLKNAYDDYIYKHNDLISYINNSIYDSLITSTESTNIASKTNNVKNALALYMQRENEAIDSIGKKYSVDAVDSSKSYTNAQITIVNNSIASKVSKTEYDANNQVISNKFTEVKQTTDSIASTVSSNTTAIKNSGDISRLRVKFNYSSLSSGSPGEFFLYGVNDNGTELSSGTFKISLKGKDYNIPIAQHNPAYYSLKVPLNQTIFICYCTGYKEVFSCWSTKNGWKKLKTTSTNMTDPNNKIEGMEWGTYYVLASYIMSEDEMIKSGIVYDVAVKDLSDMPSNSTITQLSDEISLKVSKNNVVSEINQTSESVRIKANKIQLEGATTVGDTDGNYVNIENANYTIKDSGTPKAFFGFKNMDNAGYDKYVVPKLSMGAYGYKPTHNYFTVVPYRGGDNPQGISNAYVDLAYHNIQTDDYSNIKMYDGGDIRLAPIKNLEITTNYVNGSYGGAGERRLAVFTTSGLSDYSSNLQIGVLANHSNASGLILTDRYRDSPWEGSGNGGSWRTSVRVNTDSSGAKFFRPLDNKKDIMCGSSGYPWKSVHSVSSYTSDGVIINNSITTKEEVTVDDAIDKIKFITPFTKDNKIVMDVTDIKDTNFVEVDAEGNVSKNDSELIKLLILEVQKLKQEIEILKTR